jgi:AcrR family transcriptional regulator
MSDMRARLLAAAVEVVRQQGAAGATTRAIARAAGVSEGSIFNHFPNKAALLKAVFTEGIDNPLPAATARLWDRTGAGDLRASLADFLAAAVRFYQDVLPLSAPQFLGARAVREARAEIEEPEFGPIVGHDGLTRYLSVEQRLGRLPAGADPAMLAVALLGAGQQYAFLSLTTPARRLQAPSSALDADPARFARRLVDSLLPADDPTGDTDDR